MELIDNEIVESRRTESGIVPFVVGGIAYDAIAVGISVKLQLARIRVALEPFAAGSDDEKSIEVAVFDSWYEA